MVGRLAAVTLAAVTLAIALVACRPGGGTSSPSTLPSAVPGTASPPASPAISPPVGALFLSARNRSFSPVELVGVADQPLFIVFTNHDAANHGLAIYRNFAQDELLYDGIVFSGPEKTYVYEVQALPAGEYYFRCPLFASMYGRLIMR